MLVLGIETSCDETAAALVKDGTEIISSVVHSQVERHRPFGGVVPEIAAREHVTNLVPVLEQTFAKAGAEVGDVDLVAVTDRPGLVAALLCGIAAAEALGTVANRTVCGVNHIEAHITAPFLAEGREPEYPLVSLVASGGHTHLFLSTGPVEHRLLGATIDDAAGEAFDKVARMLSLPYPGGPSIEAAARDGDPTAFDFKRPLLGRTSLDFSFSGLKTAVLYRCVGQKNVQGARGERTLLPGLNVADVAASFQAAVVDVLVRKVQRAVAATGVRRVGIGGGVACNESLRRRLSAVAEEEGWDLALAPPALCTDNGAMIAARGAHLLHHLGGEIPRPRAQARTTWERALEPRSGA